jgi:hypothetical protein
MFKHLLLSLAEPGTEGDGGSGGGGEAHAPASAVGPLPASSAREKIYEAADSQAAGADVPAEGDKATPDATPPKEPSKEPQKDSAPDGKPKSPGKDTKPDDPAEKRIKETQRAFHQKSEEAAKERKAREEAEAKLKMVEKYVDFQKLEEYDKAEEEKRLDQPLTRRDLEEIAKAKEEKTADDSLSSPISEEDSQKFLDDYYGKNKHVIPYVESGEAYGVFLKTAEKMGPELQGISPLEQLERIGKAVSDYFLQRDKEREKQIAERINTRRSAISLGESLPSAGKPRGDDPDDVGDDPKTEVSRRQSIRAQIFNPTI